MTKNPEFYLEEAIKNIQIHSVLDVGTGNSGIFDYWWWQEKKLEWRVCLDIKMIRKDVEGWDKVIADARYLPFRDKCVDHVQSCEMLEHIPPRDHRKVLKELKRVSRKTVFVTSSGRMAHRGELQKRAEEENPFQKYLGIVDRRLLEEEGFKILFHHKKGCEEHVKAFLERFLPPNDSYA